MFLHALRSLRPSACLSFQASWDRGALIGVSGSGMSQTGFAIFHLVLCSFLLSFGLWCSASRPLWTRRLASRVLLAVACARRVLLVLFTSRCVPHVVVKPMMLRIMAGMNQKDNFVARFWRTCLLFTTAGASGSDCSKTVDFPQLQSIKVVDISVIQRLILTVIETIEIPQWLVDLVSMPPFMQVVLTGTCTVFGVRLRSTRCGISGRRLPELFL